MSSRNRWTVFLLALMVGSCQDEVFVPDIVEEAGVNAAGGADGGADGEASADSDEQFPVVKVRFQSRNEGEDWSRVEDSESPSKSDHRAIVRLVNCPVSSGGTCKDADGNAWTINLGYGPATYEYEDADGNVKTGTDASWDQNVVENGRDISPRRHIHKMKVTCNDASQFDPPAKDGEFTATFRVEIMSASRSAGDPLKIDPDGVLVKSVTDRHGRTYRAADVVINCDSDGEEEEEEEETHSEEAHGTYVQSSVASGAGIVYHDITLNLKPPADADGNTWNAGDFTYAIIDGNSNPDSTAVWWVNSEGEHGKDQWLFRIMCGHQVANPTDSIAVTLDWELDYAIRDQPNPTHVRPDNRTGYTNVYCPLEEETTDTTSVDTHSEEAHGTSISSLVNSYDDDDEDCTDPCDDPWYHYVYVELSPHDGWTLEGSQSEDYGSGITTIVKIEGTYTDTAGVSHTTTDPDDGGWELYDATQNDDDDPELWMDITCLDDMPDHIDDDGVAITVTYEIDWAVRESPNPTHVRPEGRTGSVTVHCS